VESILPGTETKIQGMELSPLSKLGDTWQVTFKFPGTH
jgi:hypothetical protein